MKFYSSLRLVLSYSGRMIHDERREMAFILQVFGAMMDVSDESEAVFFSQRIFIAAPICLVSSVQFVEALQKVKHI
jgi:hypothetical protein